jgi:hypothetical protein
MVKPPEPLSKTKTLFFYDLKNNYRNLMNHKKINKKKMHVMLSAGQYRSTEKGYR